MSRHDKHIPIPILYYTYFGEKATFSSIILTIFIFYGEKFNGIKEIVVR